MTTLRATAVPQIYRSVMAECERRRLALGLSVYDLEEKAGIHDRYYFKALYPDTPSGRIARWESLDLIIGVLFRGGFRVAIESENDAMQDAPSTEPGINDKAREIRHWRHSRHFKELGLKGSAGPSYVKKVKPRKRKAIARKAARARWRKEREAQAKARVELNRQLYKALSKKTNGRRTRNTAIAIPQATRAPNSKPKAAPQSRGSARQRQRHSVAPAAR